MTNMSEERAEGKRIFQVTASQPDESTDNIPASTRIEAVANAVYDTEMGSGNAWHDFDDNHYHGHLRGSHDNQHNAIVWIQDRVSASNTGDLFLDESEYEVNKNWSMHFGDETVAWDD
jgi:hypothetical protein